MTTPGQDRHTITSLLPPGATPLQRHLEKANDLSFDIEKVLDDIKNIKNKPPRDVMYWLIWEYGLGEILPYISELSRVITDGLQWQRLRGTPQSLKIALGWIGLTGTEIEQEPPGMYYYQYQMELKRIPDSTEIRKIRNLATLSSPVRSRLSRLYNNTYDIRKLVLSSPGLFGQFLSDYSGYDHEGIVLSFGHKQIGAVSIPAVQVHAAQERTSDTEVYALEVPRLSYMLISDIPIINHTAVHGRLTMVYCGRPNNEPAIMTVPEWFGRWNERTWASPEFLHIASSRQNMRGGQIRFSETRAEGNIQKHLYQTNDEPLSFTESIEWIGRWDERPWTSTLTIKIGVKHYGNTN